MLTDNFKRKIDYLRVSVTDRCDLRCTYCMAEDVTFLPRQEVLSIEEIIKLIDILIWELDHSFYLVILIKRKQNYLLNLFSLK